MSLGMLKQWLHHSLPAWLRVDGKKDGGREPRHPPSSVQKDLPSSPHQWLCSQKQERAMGSLTVFIPLTPTQMWTPMFLETQMAWWYTPLPSSMVRG